MKILAMKRLVMEALLAFFVSFFLLSSATNSRSCPSLCQCVADGSNFNETAWICTAVTDSAVFKESDVQNVSSLTLVNSELVNGNLDGIVFPSVKHLIVRHATAFFLREEVVSSFPLLESLDISDNQIFCNESLTWLLNWKIQLHNLDETFCTNRAPSDSGNLLQTLKIINLLHTSCPKSCNCHIGFIPKTEDLPASVIVNCSYQSLVSFPQQLPPNVSIKLDLRNNNIASLAPLVSNPAYLHVPTVYLDNNKIKSLSELEGSKWIEQFSLLSIVGNKLSSLPTQAFELAYRKNKSGGEMHLGQNPWKCDCTEVTNFQKFVARYTSRVKDISDIRCASPDNHVGKKLIDVSPLCHTMEKSAVHSMDVVNTCLALLIILTVGKLLYDYYYFRKTGRLPWIISKLP